MNIPRYVDISEEEEPVDLVDMKAEIKEISVKKQVAIYKAEGSWK